MKPHNELGKRAKAARKRIRSETVKYYGTPCKYGHDGERYTRGGGCVICSSAAWRYPKKKFVNTALLAKLDAKIVSLQNRRSAVLDCTPAFVGGTCTMCATATKSTASGNCIECKKRANLRQKLKG